MENCYLLQANDGILPGIAPVRAKLKVGTIVSIVAYAFSSIVCHIKSNMNKIEIKVNYEKELFI